MSHVDMNLGVWYPAGGFGAVVDALVRLCRELGVEFVFDAEVDGFDYEGTRIVAARAGGRRWAGEVVVANADYHHVETKLLPAAKVSKPPRFWKRQVMAPTLFVVFLGLKRPLPGLVHHNLYFTGNWDEHFAAIFDRPEWPENPCFYLSCPSKSDPTVAPAGKENLFLLVPVAAGLDDPDGFREAYADRVIAHVERITGEAITPHIEVKRIFSQRDYARDYNAFQGSALGLAHTLGQTAVFRPSIRSRKVPNLFYAGQYTHPGVGVPMVLIAAQLAAKAVAETTGGAS
jgi:phytoene desaturase